MDKQPASQAPHIFSPEYYKKLERVEQQHPWSKHMQRLALSLLDRFAAGSMTRVLDAGCGAGYFTLMWREQSRPRQIVGLDSSLDGLRLSKARGVRDVVAGSVDRLVFQGNSFDAIYCADVLQHLSPEGARDTLSEFARVLRPGGLVLLRTAARRGLGSKKHRDAPDYQQWEPEKLRAHMEAAGLRIEWMSLVNWLPSLVADLRAYSKPAPVGDVGLHVAGSLEKAPLPAVGLLPAFYWSVERSFLLRFGGKLPGGHTLLCVARKR